MSRSAIITLPTALVRATTANYYTNMKSFITFAALAVLAVASGAPQQARNSYGAPRSVVRKVARTNSQPQYVAAASTRTVQRAEPIAIVRSALNNPGEPGYERSFGYSFEGANGIKQEATGEMRLVGENEVAVMRGSYEYIGDDGQTYVVDWYADETGFHPSAPHLPQPVEIPFPEQAEAVEAQLRFAEQERANQASASYNRPNVVASPVEVVEVRAAAPSYTSYGAPGQQQQPQYTFLI